MTRTIQLEQHHTPEELRASWKEEPNRMVVERLWALICISEGMTAKSTANLLGKCYRCVREWVYLYNEGGIEALRPKYRGRSPRIPDEEFDRFLDEEVKDKGLTIKDVNVLIEQRFGIQYSYNGLWYQLRKKRRISLRKPRPWHVKRPPDAEQILKKN